MGNFGFGVVFGLGMALMIFLATWDLPEDE
jgi:hypothetical protein